MLYDPPLLERGRQDFHPVPYIDEPEKGLEYELYYTGKRMGTGNQIELHITSTIRDWKETIFTRKSWYSGNKKDWKTCIENHLRIHLNDLCAGKTLVNSLLRDFELTEANFQDWNKYAPTYYGF